MSLITGGTGGGGSAGGAEVGYDQITANVTVSATVEASGTTVITAAAHTFDGAAVVAEFFSPSLAPASNDFIIVSLFEGATQIARFGQVGGGNAANPASTAFCARLRFTPTAASHTYTVTAIRSATNGTIFAGLSGTGAYVPAYLRFTKV
jgi:hypothetical protein